MKKLVNEWLKAALMDLKSIEKIINDEFLTPMVAFHSHQAIEKSLKAILELQQIKIPKIHKLQTLIDLVGIDLSEKDELLQLLDELYIDSRYPENMGLLPYGKPTLEDAKEFYEFAQSVFDKVCEILAVDRDMLK